jgi:ABC-type ATPase with predicted acetyltransferase domain
MTSYTLDIRFKSEVERNPRILSVAEAFGLGLSDQEFVIYDRVTVKVKPGDVVYINGQSGSGKSLALKELARQMQGEGLKVADLNAIELPQVPVINMVGEDIQKAAHYLSLAGISDAWIYLRLPNQLSDGQRYRVKLAKLIEMRDADVWVADEFGAVLDRVTAKVIAFNMQKQARRLGKTLIVATTHTDLVEELGPSVVIEKEFKDRANVVYFEDPA